MPLLTAMFYSFPSGHAMFAATVYGMFAYLLARQAKRAWLQVVIYVAAGAMIALVGFSRIYLGVHYLSDVAAGILLGIVWLMVCILALEIASNVAKSYHKPAGDESSPVVTSAAARRQNDEQ
jgi:undecaprenyl-diphosphatase